jgi:hypothetical protein
VAGNAGQMAALGPAAVAVHDDRDMSRELVRILLAEDFSLFTVQPWGNNHAQLTLSSQQNLGKARTAPAKVHASQG